MLGQLDDDLDRRGLLDKTWIVIVGDHGEGLGEHDLYDHGESLYSTEIHVPLLILPPAGSQPGAVVRERSASATCRRPSSTWSGWPRDRLFPGRSLAGLWAGNSLRGDRDTGHEVLSALQSPNRSDSSHGRSPARRGPLVSLAEGDLVYIYNEGDRTEELFNERDDPRELTNLAPKGAMLPELEHSGNGSRGLIRSTNHGRSPVKTITIELDQLRDQLDKALAETEHGGVIVTRQGKPWIIVHPVTEDWDAESAELAQSPEFWEMIRERRREVSIPWDKAKRQLGVD